MMIIIILLPSNLFLSSLSDLEFVFMFFSFYFFLISDATIMPCGHGGLCYRCGQVLSTQERHQQCPICRGSIDKLLKIFKCEQRANNQLIFVANEGLERIEAKTGQANTSNGTATSPASSSIQSMLSTASVMPIEDADDGNNVEMTIFEDASASGSASTTAASSTTAAASTTTSSTTAFSTTEETEQKRSVANTDSPSSTNDQRNPTVVNSYSTNA